MERYAWKKKCQSDISRQATNRPAACHPAKHQPAIQPAAMAVPASLAAASSQQPARQQAARKQPGASQLAACQPASSQPTSFQLGLILPIGTFFFVFTRSPRGPFVSLGPSGSRIAIFMRKMIAFYVFPGGLPN